MAGPGAIPPKPTNGKSINKQAEKARCVADGGAVSEVPGDDDCEDSEAALSINDEERADDAVDGSMRESSSSSNMPLPQREGSGGMSDSDCDEGHQRRGFWGLPPWVKTISDSMLVVRGGARIPMVPKLRTASLPAVLQPRPARTASNDRKGRWRPKLSRSQAQLLIPRTLSEYLDCCRFSRSQSGGLLIDAIRPEGVFADAHLKPTGFSEGLLAGRFVAFLRRAHGEDDSSSRGSVKDNGDRKPPPPRPVEALRVGESLEGKIVRSTPLGLFIAAGATRLGLLRWHFCRGAPRKLLRVGEVLSNLVVIRVDATKDQFWLDLKAVDGRQVEDVDLTAILLHIADWAKVELPAPLLNRAKRWGRWRRNSRQGNARGKGTGKGKGKGKVHNRASQTLKWRPKVAEACEKTGAASV